MRVIGSQKRAGLRDFILLEKEDLAARAFAGFQVRWIHHPPCDAGPLRLRPLLPLLAPKSAPGKERNQPTNAHDHSLPECVAGCPRNRAVVNESRSASDAAQAVLSLVWQWPLGRPTPCARPSLEKWISHGQLPDRNRRPAWRSARLPA